MIPQTLKNLACILGLLLALNLGAKEIETPKIVCFGDSITKRGYPAELAKILDVQVIAAGVAGNSTTDGLKRLQTEVIDQAPTHVIVLFGTNDNRIDAPHKYVPVESYSANLRVIIGQCQSIEAKVILCTLPPINQDTYFERHETTLYDEAGGLPEMMERTRQAVLKLGKEFDLPVVDLNKQLLKTPEWMHKDGVHPSPEGNRIIAELVAQKIAPLLDEK